MKGAATSFRKTSFVVQTKIRYCETTITNKVPFWRQKLSQFVRKFVFQNKAKNAGRSGKNSGMREIRKMRDFPHDCGMVDTYALRGRPVHSDTVHVDFSGNHSSSLQLLVHSLLRPLLWVAIVQCKSLVSAARLFLVVQFRASPVS